MSPSFRTIEPFCFPCIKITLTTSFLLAPPDSRPMPSCFPLCTSCPISGHRTGQHYFLISLTHLHLLPALTASGSISKAALDFPPRNRKRSLSLTPQHYLRLLPNIPRTPFSIDSQATKESKWKSSSPPTMVARSMWLMLSSGRASWKSPSATN